MNEMIAKLLTIHICLTFVATLANKNNDVRALIASVSAITLIILWNLAMKTARKNGFSRAVFVSLFFTVPSLLFGIASYYSYFYEDGIGMIMVLSMYGMMFNQPFMPYIGIFTEDVSIYAQIAIPIISINLLLLINYFEYKLEKTKKTL